MISVDATWEMLRVAHVKRATAAVQADAQALPAAPESVDTVATAPRVDGALDGPQAIGRLLRAAGVIPERIWSETAPPVGP